MLVRPYNDIGVAGDLDLTGFVVGGSRDADLHRDHRRGGALASARFTARNYLPGLRVTAIRGQRGRVPASTPTSAASATSPICRRYAA